MRPLILLVLLCTPLLGAGYATDEQGRALILHGANVDGDAKSAPLRLPSVDPRSVARMAEDWGFNFARFLIFWDALEPQPGGYDDVYLDRVAERLDWFQAAGIHVVLDMHQDVYSQFFCCDGAPTWAIRDDGLPFTRKSPWWVNYFEPAVVRAFDNFWANDAGLQDHYATGWQRVAARLGDHPSVLGYDLMNEPWSGSLLNSPELFDQGPYAEFLDRVIAAIRQVDPDSWIFYEPRSFGPNGGAPSFVQPPDDPSVGYMPHLYSLGVDVLGHYDPENDPTVPNWERERRSEADLLDGPVLLGEFGHTDGVENSRTYLEDILAMADRITSGWAYWEYNDDGFGFLNPDGTEKPDKVDLLVRAYPQRIAGEPISYGYDPDTRIFSLQFLPTPHIKAPTEIYIPARRFYPGGFIVEVGKKSWSSDNLPKPKRGRLPGWDPDREILTLWRAGPPNSVIAVTVRPH
jgi:endoglycosylceramidase